MYYALPMQLSCFLKYTVITERTVTTADYTKGKYININLIYISHLATFENSSKFFQQIRKKLCWLFCIIPHVHWWYNQSKRHCYLRALVSWWEKYVVQLVIHIKGLLMHEVRIGMISTNACIIKWTIDINITHIIPFCIDPILCQLQDP